MSRHLSGEDRIFTDVLLSFALLVVGGALVAAAYGVMQLYHQIGLELFAYAVGVPVGLMFIWLVGHIVNGLRPPERKKCKACPYKHGNFITEWWHNRRCLPLQIMKVGGINNSGTRG